MNSIEKFGLSVLCVFGITQGRGAVEDYSKISANELNEAFIIAVKEDSSGEVQKLVKAGANVNEKITYFTSEGDCDWQVTRTALEYAAQNGYVDTVKVLIQLKVKNDAIIEPLF
jgi:ankyrin repeat protein